MKKINKILLCFVLAFAFVMPIALGGCQLQQSDNNSDSQTDTTMTVQTDLYEHLSKIKYNIQTSLPYKLNNTNVLNNNQYRVITYGYFANNGGGFTTYKMYVGKNVTYIMEYDTVYGKIVYNQFYSATTSNGVVSYTSVGTIDNARAAGYQILTTTELAEFDSRIKNCGYIYYAGYMLNLETGAFVKVPTILSLSLSASRANEILFYRTYSDFAFNNYFARIHIYSNTVDGTISYKYGIDNYPHIYQNDNSMYDEIFYMFKTNRNFVTHKSKFACQNIKK